jgi:hypothetical protein
MALCSAEEGGGYCSTGRLVYVELGSGSADQAPCADTTDVEKRSANPPATRQNLVLMMCGATGGRVF